MRFWTSLCATVLAGCAMPAARPPGPAPIAPGSHYVALGSSFAAGPGISAVEAGSPPRCTRSVDNYAHQLARRRGLVLTDATCSGATTPHLLAPSGELPPQLDALRADTRLVTVTVGGNDLGYMAGLIGASCRGSNLQRSAPAVACRPVVEPDEAAYARVASNLGQIAAEVRRRSPQATLVFVDYATVLPARGRCAAMPLSDGDAAMLRAVDSRLRVLTATAAHSSRALLLRAGELTRDHHVCARDPWMNGYGAPGPAGPFAVYHPTLAGMSAVAEALDRLLGRAAPDRLN